MFTECPSGHRGRYGSRYRDSELIRLFALAVHQVTGVRPVDPAWESRPRGIRQQYELRLQRMDIRFDQKLRQIYERAMDREAGKGMPAAKDPGAYWAAGVLAYFDAASRKPPQASPNLIKTREKLRSCDPELYALVHETMAYEGRIDWRY